MIDTDALLSDRPSTDPEHDLFGHAPFAKTLAKAVRSYHGKDGIVVALYGPWGSGKSTVLAYVQHELENLPVDDRPVVVSFNPWWFSGQEHLAKAFLGQLQAVLPSKYKGFEKIGNLLSEFSDAIGGVADFAGTSIGVPFFGQFAKAGTKRLASKPRDVPALKKGLADLLLEQRKRVLVIIDDIDRLAPDEVRQLFTVIKALADFPYVTYLLAFDRNVAASAISEQTGLPGERYLEKIIQVPFELPRPERATLHQALFKRLDAVMAPTPSGYFDSTHWNNIFHSGLAPLISMPRDIVRLTNVLTVTYPAVVGEVNPVDFIAVEALRVFLPSVYDVIRSSPEEFIGYVPHGGHSVSQEHERVQAFHANWLEAVPEPLKASIKDMVERLFPRLSSVWGNVNYDSNSLREWRRQLRICAPEVFWTYFRFSIAPDTVSRAEINMLLAAADSSASFAERLESAGGVTGVDGGSKVTALLDRFIDHVEDEVNSTDAQPIIEALFEIGDKLLKASQNTGTYTLGNETRVGRLVCNVLKKIPSHQRTPILLEALGKGKALRCSQYVIVSLTQEAERAAKYGSESLVSEADTEELKTAWCLRVKELSANHDFIDHPSVAWLVSTWREWSGTDEAVAWWQAATTTDEGLLKLISAHAMETRVKGDSDLTWRTYRRVDPRHLAPYGDLEAIAERVQSLLEQGGVADQYQALAEQFVRACKRIRSGHTPDQFGFFDDED